MEELRSQDISFGSFNIKMTRENSYLTCIPADTDLGTQEMWQYDVEYSTMMKAN